MGLERHNVRRVTRISYRTAGAASTACTALDISAAGTESDGTSCTYAERSVACTNVTTGAIVPVAR